MICAVCQHTKIEVEGQFFPSFSKGNKIYGTNKFEIILFSLNSQERKGNFSTYYDFNIFTYYR